jgi:alpha-tubulin suppressor-like RCC1 family protein
MRTIWRSFTAVCLLTTVAIVGTGPSGLSATRGAHLEMPTAGSASLPLPDVAPSSRAPSAKRPPSKPLGVTIAGGERSVRVTWKKPKRTGSHPISGYRIQRSIAGGSWTTVTTVGPKIRAFTVAPLPTAATIRVRVAAVSRGGTSKWSSVRSAVLPTVLQVSGGQNSTCALLPSRSVVCWGQNSKGQLGIGNSSIPRIPVPVLVPGLTDVREITSGIDHHCARRGDGTVWCWGDSLFGQLTIASVGNHAQAPVQIPGIAVAAQVSAGGSHTCIRTTASGVQCWGGNGNQQLGAPVVSNLAVVAISGVAEVRGGRLHTCARLTSGEVRCWGRNFNGESGTSVPAGSDISTPSPVAGVANARGLALGEAFTCAVLADGSARCWGRGDGGQLGDGSTASSTSAPQVVVDAGPIESIAAGAFSMCARYRDARVRCWGSNFFGNLGTGSSGGNQLVPVLSELGPALSLGSGYSQTCAISTSGRLRCAGRNNEGQLGDGSTTNRASPVSPSGL